MFHNSMLKKCIGDTDSILTIMGLAIQENLSYEEVSVEILDKQVNKLRNEEVTFVKVLWKNYQVEGEIKEAEDNMKSRYPHLFDN